MARMTEMEKIKLTGDLGKILVVLGILEPPILWLIFQFNPWTAVYVSLLAISHGILFIWAARKFGEKGQAKKYESLHKTALLCKNGEDQNGR